LDKLWSKIVIHQVPFTDTTQRDTLLDELITWNKGVTKPDVMARRELCSLEALRRRRERVKQGQVQTTSYLLMLANGDTAKRLVRDGAFIYGSHCRVSLYDPGKSKRHKY
jgi:hypothetical protein